jgi:hypothetical protein
VVISGFPNSYSGRSHFDRTYIFEHLVGYRFAPVWIRQCKWDYFLAALAAIRARKFFSC